LRPIGCKCWEKRKRAVQRCNSPRDIPVDGAPMVSPVPGGPLFAGDSVFQPLDTGVMPKKLRCWMSRILPSDEP